MVSIFVSRIQLNTNLMLYQLMNARFHTMELEQMSKKEIAFVLPRYSNITILHINSIRSHTHYA